MFRRNRPLITISMFLTMLCVGAASASAEHIFFRSAVNGTTLSSGADAPTSLLSSGFSALDGPTSNVNTIISPDGQFTFSLTCFNLKDPGRGGLVELSFLADESSTLPAPLSQVFNYDGNGTKDKPETFSFSVFLPPGIFNGDLILTYTETKGPEKTVITYPITLISQPVPEPATMLLLATGLSGLAVKAGRRKRKDLR